MIRNIKNYVNLIIKKCTINEILYFLVFFMFYVFMKSLFTLNLVSLFFSSIILVLSVIMLGLKLEEEYKEDNKNLN